MKPPVDPAETELLIDLGGGHWYVPLHRDGVLWGIDEWHRNSRGEWCSGWIPVKTAGRTDPRYWDLHSEQPLTIAPSVLCGCGVHGFIEQGWWRNA